MLEGGMSGSYVYQEQESKFDYIADVFNTLIIRDIRQKYIFRYQMISAVNQLFREKLIPF